MNPKLLLLVAAACAAFAQSPADFEKSIKAAMGPALAQQRASVRKQAASVIRPASSSAGSSFFTLPPVPIVGAGADCDPLPDDQLDPLIETAAAKEEVDAHLVRAVIDKESAGRPCAVSISGAEGLMQLMPATAEQFEVRDAFDPRQNVEAGTKLLKLLLNRYSNDPALTLSAYNAGPGRVDEEGGIPAIPETVEYVADILSKLGLHGSVPAVAKPNDETLP